MITFPLSKDKSPAVPKGTSWQDYSGDVNTPMIGVAIPKGVFVIDIDLYKGITYQDIDAALGCSLDWETSLIQETLNGGVHHAFSIPDDLQLVNGKNVVIDGLDTRSSGKGYIATGKGYTDKTDHGIIDTFEMSEFVLPELVPKAIELFKFNSSQDECSDLATIVANSDTLELSLDEIKDYLDCLPPSAADDDWLNVVMAVYHETQGSEEGYALVDEWSQQCPDKYDEAKNRRRWDSSRNDSNPNPITFKTVIKLAGGKKATQGLCVTRLKEKIEHSSTRLDLDSLLSEVADLNTSNIDMSMLTDLLQKKYSQVADIKISKPDLKKEIKKHKTKAKQDNFVDEYVFCTTSALYVRRDNLVSIGPRAFATKHNRETPPNSEGAFQSATVYADNTIEIVDDTMYLPWADCRFTMEGVEYFNTFKELEHEHVEVGTSNAVDIILAHAQWLLPEEREREILLSFIAHQVQNKGKLLQWALVLQGSQGDGKSFWAELMTHLLGNHNVGIVSPTQFGSKFNAWAHGHLLNIVEELKVASGTSQYDVLNQVKPLITNPKITVEGKGVNSKEVVNCTNYFCTTNFKDAVPIDAFDRRWCVLFTKGRDVQEFCDNNPSYFTDLYKGMRDNIPELYNFFSNYTIPDWFKNGVRAPKTANRDEMIELSKSECEVLFEMALEEFAGDFLNDQKVDITYLNAKIEAVVDAGDGRFDDFPKTRTLRKILLSRGYSNVSRDLINNKLHRVYRK